MNTTSTFLWNIFLTLVWMFGFGRLSLSSLAEGFLLGYLALWLGRDVFGSGQYTAKVVKLLSFLAFFLWELLLANLRVAYDVLTPTHHMRPGIIALPLDAKTDGEIVLLANLISLTPGTLSLDISADRSVLYVHTMYMDDPEREKRLLKSGMERRLLEVLR
jgi:multicomponent Na+:H+ antiporter subunit E